MVRMQPQFTAPTSTVNQALEISPDEVLLEAHLEGCFEGIVKGVTIPGVLPKDACRTVASAIRARTTSDSSYAGGELSSVEGLATWPLRVEQGDTPEVWHEYFNQVGRSDTTRAALCQALIGVDPYVVIKNVLQSAWSKGAVKRAVHPRFGRRMNGMIIRGGVADLHYDHAGLHAGLPTCGHVGIVLIIDAMDGAFQRVYADQISGADSGGHYAMERPSKGTAYLDIPTPVGSLSFLSATFLHEVYDDPMRRITAALHAVLTPSGDIVLYA